MTRPSQRAAIYARVSSRDQDLNTQLHQLRRYVTVRRWTAVEYVDTGGPGGTDHRPALDRLLRDAAQGQVDVLVCARLDRLGRTLRHLVALLDGLQEIGVPFVSVYEGIDGTTPVGRVQLHVLAALAEFERARIAETVAAGLARARTHGQRLGRPQKVVSETVLAPVRGLSVREAARRLGVSPSTAYRWLCQPPREVTTREAHPNRKPRLLQLVTPHPGKSRGRSTS